MKKNIQKELLDLLKQIIEIDTCYPPGSSKNFGKFVSSYLKNSGLLIRSYGVDKEKINICASNYQGSKKSIVSPSPPLAP